MSKTRDEYYKWNKTTLPMRDGVCTDYVSELEQENRTLKLEQGQCLNCTAKHKEELLVLEQEIEEYIKIYAVLTDDVRFLKQQKMELIECLKNVVGTCKNFASNVDIRWQKEVLNKYREEKK